MKNQNTVNIIIPTRNYGRFIAEALDSALNQSYKDLIITIIDNNSTDNTASIVKKYLAKHKNIKYYKNKTDLGLVGNLNRCLELNDCKYATLLCSDDILEKDFLKDALKMMKKYDAGVVFGGETIIDKEGKVLSLHVFEEDTYSKDSTWYFKDSLRVPAVSGVLFNAAHAKKMKFAFIEDYRFCPELDLWLRLSEKHGMYYMTKMLIRKRLHGNNDSYVKDDKTRVKHVCECVDNFLIDHPVYAGKKKSFGFNGYLGCTLFALRFNIKDEGMKYLKKCLRLMTPNKISLRLMSTIMLLITPASVNKILISKYDRFMRRIPESLSTTVTS